MAETQNSENKRKDRHKIEERWHLFPVQTDSPLAVVVPGGEVLYAPHLYLYHVLHYKGGRATGGKLARTIGPRLNHQRSAKNGSHQICIEILPELCELGEGGEELPGRGLQHLHIEEGRLLDVVAPGGPQEVAVAECPGGQGAVVDGGVVVAQLPPHRLQLGGVERETKGGLSVPVACSQGGAYDMCSAEF